ncbi:MAG TPA: hypothetical protein VE869_17010 [Gemmatimonas sp.]|nr:hypothetical protein [Gemmatimonas sp.]
MGSDARRAGIVLGILLLASVAAWLLWPRPDAVIRIARGGAATVGAGPLGRSAPLGDTIAIGGSGWRRVELINEDTIPHQIAMFRVPVGSTSSYRVPPGVYGGLCTAHPTKRAITFIAR